MLTMCCNESSLQEHYVHNLRTEDCSTLLHDDPRIQTQLNFMSNRTHFFFSQNRAMTQGNLSLQHVPASCPAPCTLVGDQPRSQGHSSFTLGTRLVSVCRNSTCTGTDFCGGDLVASHPLWRRKKILKNGK